MTAFVIVHGEPTLALLDDRVLSDARVMAMARCIEIECSLPDGPGHPPAKIRVEHDGPAFEVQPPLDLRMSHARTRAKFEDCIAYSRLPVEASALWNHVLAAPDSSSADSLADAAVPCRSGIEDMPPASLTGGGCALSLGISSQKS
jgi:hypothetical protein